MKKLLAYLKLKCNILLFSLRVWQNLNGKKRLYIKSRERVGKLSDVVKIVLSVIAVVCRIVFYYTFCHFRTILVILCVIRYEKSINLVYILKMDAFILLFSNREFFFIFFPCTICSCVLLPVCNRIFCLKFCFIPKYHYIIILKHIVKRDYIFSIKIFFFK